jgi:DNA-binding HxlR family transcriptional regulator
VLAGRSYGDWCGVARSLDVLGERWALLVVRELLLGPKRFADLQHGLHNVSPNVLSRRLQALIQDGVVSRRQLGPPTRVQLYELTEWGKELEPVLLHLGKWGGLAKVPEERQLSVDSMMLGIKAAHVPERHKPAVYEVRLADETFALRITTDGIDIRRGTADQPSAIAETDVRTFQALMTGERSIDDTCLSGDLRFVGAAQATKQLKALLSATVPSPSAG